MSDENEELEESAEEFDARMQKYLKDSAAEKFVGVEVSLGKTGGFVLQHPRMPKDAPDLPAYANIDPPEAVVAARDVVDDAWQRLDEVMREIEALKGRAQTVNAAHLRSVMEAEREGRAVPKAPKLPDDEADLQVLFARFAGRRAVYDEALRAHKRELEQARPEWLQRLRRLQSEAKEQAVESLPAILEAARSVDRLEELVRATEALWLELHPTASSPPRRPAGVNLRSVPLAVQQLQEAFATDHPYFDGRWVDDTIKPPIHVRQEWANRGGHWYHEIADVEELEDFKVTAFTRADAPLYGRGIPQTRPDGTRFAS